MKRFATIAIVFTLIAAICVAVSFQLALGGLEENMERRAFSELNASTTSQALYLQRTVELQYAPLEALAAYLSVCDNEPREAFLEYSESNNASVLANRLCMLGYADMEGNAISYAGVSLGNIADRAYFQDATFWKGEYSIEYMASTALTTEARVLFGVPVLRRNKLVGMVFCAKEIEVFEDSIFTNGFDGNEMTIITTGDGDIIAAGGNSAGRFPPHGNLFEEYTAQTIAGSSLEKIIGDMEISKSGFFSTKGAKSEYVYYAPLGVNSWYIWGITDSDVARSNFAANVNNYMRGVYVFAAFYVLTLFAAFIVMVQHNKAMKRDKAVIEQQSERYQTILHEMDSAVYDYNIATQRLTISDAFEKRFGYALLENWTEEVKTNSEKHPEIDYAGIMEAKGRVETSGEMAEAVFQAQTKCYGMRWFRISMNPLFDENRHMISIYGLVTDITEEQEDNKRQALERARLIAAVKVSESVILSANLSKNSYSILSGKHFIMDKMSEHGETDELVKIAAEIVSEPDRHRFLDTFSCDRLLDAFSAGENHVELDYCCVGGDGATGWVRTQAIRVDNPYDEDVIGIVLTRNIDEQKAYQALLQRTYDLTVENMPCFAVKWLFADGDVLLLEANKKYLDFMHISESEAYNHSIIYGFSEREKAEIINMLYACERERRSITFANRACKANGEECYLHVQASFFEERDGKSVYYGTLEDITELVATQTELKNTVEALRKANGELAANNAYHDLLNSSVDGGMMVYSALSGEALELQYVSPGLLNTLGCTLSEFEAGLTDGMKSLIHPNDYESFVKASRDNQNLGDHFSTEYRIRHRDGHYIWMVQHSQVVEGVDRTHALSVAALLSNITHQKDLERQLRISEEEYKIAADLSDHSVFTFDIASRSFSVVSPGLNAVNFAKITGNIPESLIREGYIAPESVEVIRELFDDICQGASREKTVLALNDCDARKRWVEVTYSLTHDREGNVITAVMSFIDITERQRTERLLNVSSTFLKFAQRATKLMILNISTSTLEYETEGPHGLLAQSAESSDISAIYDWVFSHAVYTNDMDAFAEFFAQERFLVSYQKGMLEESFEYRGLSVAGTPHWMNVQTRIVEDTGTKEILLYVVASDINDQKLTELALLRKARTDGLTGLMNRESFEEEMAVRFADLTDKSRGSFDALIMIDVDRFKQINESFGHDTGDAILKEVAARIRGSLRSDDPLARYGSDEFIVMLPGMTSVEMIQERCLRLCESIACETKGGVSVSVSMGIAVCPDDGDNYETLLKKADAAMYQARHMGGNCAARYSLDGVKRVLSNGGMKRTKKVFARTFGYFDLFIDGVPLRFSNAKEKELLAILIDRNGGTLNAEEAISYLWENEPAEEKQNARYRKLAMNLKNTLQEAGIGDILIANRGVRSIDTTRLQCDYYQFLKGDPEFKRFYQGVYMTNYSWSEGTTATLDGMA